MNTFTLNSNKLAIGDPVMGMTVIDFNHHGNFYIEKGGLINHQNNTPMIDLDSPEFFVLDAEYLQEFETWLDNGGRELMKTIKI